MTRFIEDMLKCKVEVHCSEELVEKLAENERHIIRIIYRNKRISISDMAKEVGISTTAVHKNLTKLKQRGILRRVGPDKGGHWEVAR